MKAQAARPRIKKGDIVVWSDGRAFRPDANWRRALNGIDRDAYEVAAVYRDPVWTNKRRAVTA